MSGQVKNNLFQVTSIDVAINYQKNNTKGKMSAEELLKFLSNFAKTKNITADWKQILIQESAFTINREASKLELSKFESKSSIAM